MDAINQEILKQLQEYAQKYFAAIVETNTKDGECNLKPGKYSAKDLTDNFKAPCGVYIHPAGEEYENKITATAGTFKCSFPYRRIFAVLADWETMCKAGKQKAIFEIGEVEEKSAKVLVNDKSVLDTYKTKTMKLQRIGGNWWGRPKEIQKEGTTTGYYELNGVMFAPGKTFWGKVRDESNKRFTEKFDDAEITKMLISYLAKYPDNEATPYFAEVARLAGISTETEEAKTIADSAKEEQRRREEERQREEAEERERKRIHEEEYRKSIEEEKHQAAESLAKAKEKFIAGEMISLNDFERIADLMGYEINIRTLGTVRKRIAWIEVAKDGTPTVYGTKKRAGLDGTFATIREVYELVKAQSEEITKQAEETTEIPEATNYTTEPEKRATKPRNKPKQVVRTPRTTEGRTCKKYLIVQNVPRRSTEYHFVDVDKMVYVPPGCFLQVRHPPIRGDCEALRLTRQTTTINKIQRLNYKIMNFLSNLFKRSNKQAETQQPTVSKSERVEPVENPDKLTTETVELIADSIQPQQPTTLKEAFEMKYPAYMNILKMFEAANLCDATWENLTKVRLQRFIDYMNERLSPNSVNQYATKLKAVLNLYSDEVLLPQGFAKVLTPKKTSVQNVYLSEKEIQKIVNYTPKNDRESLVQAQFIIGILTLARHSDFIGFDEGNIVGDNLVYVSQKTKIQSSIPVSPTLLRFLKVQKEIISKGVEVSDDSFNDIIRRICMKCGIDEPTKLYQRGETKLKPKYQYISSHTARRSGVTNLYLRGLDLLTISKIAGHTDTKTTLGYVCCGIRELPQIAKDYFTGF